MLISPPFLLPRNANESDADFVARCMPDTSVMVAGTQAPEGAFPVSFRLGWHGGRHLEAPVDASGAVLDVRAIADGEIVYARRPTARNANPSPTEPRNYNPYGDAPAWTDDGCVIIRHTTEIGADAQNQPVVVSFLSIYMHLSELRGAAHRVAAGGQDRAVYRKDEIGVAGMIYGNDRQLHLEIVCDDANLEALIGRRAGALNTAVDGRNDVIFGEMYFRLPAGTPFFAQRPAFNETRPAVAPAHVLQGVPCYVGLRYAGGDGPQGHRGDAWLTSYDEDGVALGDPLNEGDAEYELYRSANDISNAYPANARPAPSAVYELLRFGRVIGPDALVPADVPHWREVRYPGGQGWVNLNAAGVRKFSDADFPQWRGWTLIDDDVDADSRCESAALTRLIEDPGAADGSLTRSELERRLQLPAVRERLARVICKFPGEWDRASARGRWGWLVGDPEFGLDASDFGELIAHIEALTFPWAAAGTGIGGTHWHWDPLYFVLNWRNCTWLGAADLERVLVFAPAKGVARAVSLRIPMGQTMRKYLLAGRAIRIAHCLAQIGHETGWWLYREELGNSRYFRTMYELITPNEAVSDYRSGLAQRLRLVNPGEGEIAYSRRRPSAVAAKAVSLGNGVVSAGTGGMSGDGSRFRGRGFLQLTGRKNYQSYSRYRGRDFTTDPNPSTVSTDDLSACDVSGFYWVREQVNREADLGETTVQVSRVGGLVNRGNAKKHPLHKHERLKAFQSIWGRINDVG
ncbi:M23 family metallopeptidase [Cognatazoarcus halotolerans]|uniref:M23 family metallopeptidase n=1 Tax=Cognatazoarcus halotolerans TaxID=2686016 RepID=UPI0013570820|nr:M23 family metallopeptidase [Cognatazoarcus halotolerans]MCB1899916.1 hypothetical protein [Rhodocyclaceae bacterium]MCP5308194.1 hydroxyethylthiazole kinase [Zoogloeaceae bacterium]